ncbi:MAG: 23S rRNA (uracil(1939)-C(5))-methyltransferase RlmD [Clostridia bacterium]|nr:23S rRNA (uracil(1939)-C(5))-methyltransferase RlmD [Clostridia bacterium]
MVVGEKLQLNIEATTGTGDGIAHADGIVVFVRGAVRGDLCLAEVDRVTRRAAFCHICELISPSPARIEPDCSIADRCGGCPARHMTYAEELSAKAQHVKNCLRRIGSWNAEPDRILAAPSRDGYRNKALLRYDPASFSFGFCEAGSHSPVPGCCRALLSCEDTDRAVNLIAAHCRQTDFTPYGLLVRRSLRHGDLLLAILSDDPIPEKDTLVATLTESVPELTGIVRCPAPKKGGIGIGRDPELLFGTQYIRETLMGIDFSVAPAAFFQVNTLMAEKLYETAAEYIRDAAPASVLDLYCGIGSIGLCTTPPETRLIGVEIVPAAVECAKENAAACGRCAEFIAADASAAAAELARRGETPDLIILDPPRKGLSEDLCDLLCKMAPPHLVYISCDPATLARDIARLSEGYTPQKYSVCDLFPGTDHVETVCLLSKLNAKQHIEINLDMDELDLTDAEKKATYQEIKDYVLEHSGLKVSSLYIAQVKQKCGIIERENYNKPKSEDAKQPQCPPDKEKAIKEALTHFDMI